MGNVVPLDAFGLRGEAEVIRELRKCAGMTG
jgi:hypothetical protein